MSYMFGKCQNNNDDDRKRLRLSGASQISEHFTAFNLLALRERNRISYYTHLTNEETGSRKNLPKVSRMLLS